MRRLLGLLPRIEIAEQCGLTEDREVSGTIITLIWGRLVIECFAGWIDRSFDQHDMKEVL